MSKTKKDARKNEERSSFSSYTSSSSDEEVDARDLKPIKEYLSDRKELGCQLFKSVKPEKIRMMLPQILKQADLKELEQWCVSELNGMSKTRILSILNDKPMLESSDTSETEDSGPSLEIISDTEEWMTDDDVCKKEDDGTKKLKKNKIKVKGKSQISKTSDTDKSNVKNKVTIKNDNIDKTKDVKIKKEGSKDKEKEGDSLLDLLELEMRARAIRALIRKEEDIIPSANSSQTNNTQTTDNDAKILQDDAIAKEDYRKQLERIINAKQGSIGEDEDVVLVVQPTPVVELLSSESDGENNEGSVNDKLKNKHVTETEKSTSSSNENVKIMQLPQDSKERKETQQETASQNNTDIVFRVDLNTRGATKTKMSERNVDIKNNILSISISADNVADKRKKSKRRLRTKSQVAPSTCNIVQDSPRSKRIKNIEVTEQLVIRDENVNKQSETSSTLVETEVTAEEKNSAKEEIAEESKVEKEKSADSDEIIDLDDYCDVMDIDNCDDDKSQDKIIVPSQHDKESVSQPLSSAQTSESSETWASRYYQTDDVQNVIKESKIQSEIRKRLRERQRLSKLNKSPNTNLSSQTSANQTTSVVSEKVPTGSVEEYLALKRASNTNISVSNSDSNVITIQDNSATVSSINDINTENLVQDESNPFHPESTNSTNVAIETNCPPSLPTEAVITEAVTTEVVTAEAREEITETTNDTEPT